MTKSGRGAMAPSVEKVGDAVWRAGLERPASGRERGLPEDELWEPGCGVPRVQEQSLDAEFASWRTLNSRH